MIFNLLLREFRVGTQDSVDSQRRSAPPLQPTPQHEYECTEPGMEHFVQEPAANCGPG